MGGTQQIPQWVNESLFTPASQQAGSLRALHVCVQLILCQTPISPTAQEAAQEDYTKQSHFVQPPSSSRALLSRLRAMGFASSLKLPVPWGSFSSKSPWGEGGNCTWLPPTSFFGDPELSVSHWACAWCRGTAGELRRVPHHHPLVKSPSPTMISLQLLLRHTLLGAPWPGTANCPTGGKT